MSQFFRTYSQSTVAKSAFTLLSTCASSLLVPVALSHTSNVYNRVLVLVIAAIWIASLTQMWVHVITLLRSDMPAPPQTSPIHFEDEAGRCAV